MAFQLTSSRRGWQERRRIMTEQTIISTHILTKRMTVRIANFTCPFTISTHILTKRMTCIIPVNTSSSKAFQLTSSRRGWLHILIINIKYITFQLTSSRRGWPPILSQNLLQNHFNSHPHEEDDCKKIK